MNANSGEPWSEMDIAEPHERAECRPDICPDCELPVQGRGRGAAEGEGARVNRAPRQAHSDGSLSRSSFDLAGTGPARVSGCLTLNWRWPRFRTRLDLAGLPLDVNHPGAWGSRVSRLDLDRDQPGLGQFPSVESAGSENALAAVAGRPQLHVKTPVLMLCYSIFIAGHARYYGLSRSRAPVARSWLNDRCSVAGFFAMSGLSAAPIFGATFTAQP
jgi:hypothetical protein